MKELLKQYKELADQAKDMGAAADAALSKSLSKIDGVEDKEMKEKLKFYEKEIYRMRESGDTKDIHILIKQMTALANGG